MENLCRFNRWFHFEFFFFIYFNFHRFTLLCFCFYGFCSIFFSFTRLLWLSVSNNFANYYRFRTCQAAKKVCEKTVWINLFSIQFNIKNTFISNCLNLYWCVLHFCITNFCKYLYGLSCCNP